MRPIVDGDSVALASHEGVKAWPDVLGWECWAVRESTAADLCKRAQKVPVGARYYAHVGVWSAFRPPEGNGEPIVEFRERLEWLADYLAWKGCAVTLVTLPAQVGTHPYNFDIHRYSRAVREAAQGRDCRVFDLEARMLAIAGGCDGLLERPDYRNHLSSEGHKLLARWLA